MRNILVEHARRHQALKRGGMTVQVPLDEAFGISMQKAPEVIALDDALEDLARRSPRQSRIAEMRWIAGLNLEEVAAVEKISRSTASREWRAALLFLRRQLKAS